MRLRWGSKKAGCNSCWTLYEYTLPVEESILLPYTQAPLQGNQILAGLIVPFIGRLITVLIAKTTFENTFRIAIEDASFLRHKRSSFAEELHCLK